MAAHPADAPPRHSQGVTQLEPSEEPAAQLDVGIAVKVDGLASKPELNGKVRIPHRSHTDTTRIPHRYHTDTTRIPHGYHTDSFSGCVSRLEARGKTSRRGGEVGTAVCWFLAV